MALLQFGLYAVRIKRTDAERDVAHRCAAQGWSDGAWRIGVVRTSDQKAADLRRDCGVVLATFVAAGDPAKQRLIESNRLLVVRYAERNVIEVDRLPAGWLEEGFDTKLSVGRARPASLRVAVADLKIETIRIFHVKTVEVLFSIMIRNCMEAPRLQRRLNLLGIPWLDAKAEAVP